MKFLKESKYVVNFYVCIMVVRMFFVFMVWGSCDCECWSYDFDCDFVYNYIFIMKIKNFLVFIE